MNIRRLHTDKRDIDTGGQTRVVGRSLFLVKGRISFSLIIGSVA